MDAGSAKESASKPPAPTLRAGGAHAERVGDPQGSPPDPGGSGLGLDDPAPDGRPGVTVAAAGAAASESGPCSQTDWMIQAKPAAARIRRRTSESALISRICHMFAPCQHVRIPPMSGAEHDTPTASCAHVAGGRLSDAMDAGSAKESASKPRPREAGLLQ
jgi:hypothetical protein